MEANWKGPLRANESVDATLRKLQTIERAADPEMNRNWRFEEALYRAYTDAYVRHRLIDETQQETRSLALLAAASAAGSLAAMTKAEQGLAPDMDEVARLHPWRSSIEDLAARLFQHIGLQLSVAKFGASAIDRGASLDTVDVSLNDRVWMVGEFKKIRSMEDENARRAAIDAIVHWREAGPGGFYDDLGDPEAEPRLVRGPGFPSDPSLLHSAYDGIAQRTPDQGWRLSRISCAGSLFDHAWNSATQDWMALRPTNCVSPMRVRITATRFSLWPMGDSKSMRSEPGPPIPIRLNSMFQCLRLEAASLICVGLSPRGWEGVGEACKWRKFG